MGLLAATGSACPKGSTSSPRPEVVFRADGREVRVSVELARTRPEREQGLMNRTSLPSGTGMLFLFEQPQPLVFWMKNTLIPLDMIFLDGDRRVVGIEENAEPLTLQPRGPGTPAQYVVEVPGGWAKQNGVALGCEVQFNHVVH